MQQIRLSISWSAWAVQGYAVVQHVNLDLQPLICSTTCPASRAAAQQRTLLLLPPAPLAQAQVLRPARLHMKGGRGTGAWVG